MKMPASAPGGQSKDGTIGIMAGVVIVGATLLASEYGGSEGWEHEVAFTGAGTDVVR